MYHFSKQKEVVVVALLIAALIAIGIVVSEDFRTVRNFQNLFEQMAGLAFASLAQTVVILIRGIDLSIDAQIALISTLVAGTIDGNPALVLPVAIGALILGATIGVVNGLLVHVLRIHALIVTLGMAAILQGLALTYAIMPVGSIPTGYDFFAFGRVFGVPVGTATAILMFILVGIFLKNSRQGRHIYALGSDPDAAQVRGLRSGRLIVGVYGFAGFMTAFASLFVVSRLGVGNPVADSGLNLSSIAAVVVGGTMLSGGRGSVLGTLLGVFLLQLLNNLLNFLDVSTFYQWMAQGVIVVIAASVYVQRKGR